jgi:hypothetical protein
MRMLMYVKLPLEPFNTAVRNGTVAKTLRKILDALKPEATYFTEHDGHRGAILVLDVKDPSAVPALAEPWFLAFNAECKFRIAMTPEDLGRSGLEDVAKNW